MRNKITSTDKLLIIRYSFLNICYRSKKIPIPIFEGKKAHESTSF